MKIRSLFNILFINLLFSLAANAGGVALVIIDMQPFYLTRGADPNEPSNAKKLENLFTSQIQAINAAKKFNHPILIVERSGLGRTYKPLLDAVQNYDRAYFFEKNKNGMFDFGSISREPIKSFLDENDIQDLVIMGANGGACVYDSIWGAISLGSLQVTAFSKGIADFNYESYIYPYDDRYQKYFPLRFNEIDDISDLNFMFENF
jgi:nicotinamidase-related amidase